MIGWIIALILLFLWFAYREELFVAQELMERKEKKDVIIRLGKTAVKADLAISLRKRMRGLSGKLSGSLLFIFPKVGRHGIWMQGMFFPIDIIYLSEEKKVVHIVEHARPFSLNPKTWRIYYPSVPVKYILEVEAGFVKENQIRIGTKAVW